MRVRRVTAELIRTGPAHNQLMSPLVQYIGVCDGAEAGLVNLPYEHSKFHRRMVAIRNIETDEGPAHAAVNELSAEVARLLGSIPRLPGSITGDFQERDTLIHLRMVLSASELALIPFELSNLLIGPAVLSESRLLLQKHLPVVMTRRTRDTIDGIARWPLRPRVLFIAGYKSEGQFDDHREALIDAMKPFAFPGRDDPVVSSDRLREQFGDLLVVLREGSFTRIINECSAHAYTHIHILASSGTLQDGSVGLTLASDAGKPDIVSPERLASALTTFKGDVIHRPSVVTYMSCGDAAARPLELPTASIAHTLHQSGIAMVLASHFPMSATASLITTKEFYRDILLGSDPLSLLHSIRTALCDKGNAFDWANLVVYEALPIDFKEQFEVAKATEGVRRLRVFLCHGSEDKPGIRELYVRLQNESGIKPWLDEIDIPAGADWEATIRHAVRDSHIVLACLSRSSVGKTGFLQKEIRFVLDRADEKPDGARFVFPVRLDDCELPERLRKWQATDLYRAGGYERLISALAEEASSTRFE